VGCTRNRTIVRVSVPAPVMVGGGVGEAEVGGIHGAGEGVSRSGGESRKSEQEGRRLAPR
jgi:hypothetical protein